MSLLRLLTAGRSLVGLKRPEKSYQVGFKGALPKFERKANPFRVTTRPEATASAATSAAKQELKGAAPAPPLGPAEPALDALKQTQKLPSDQVLPRAEPESVAAPGSPPGGAGWVKRAVTSLRNPFGKSANQKPDKAAPGSKPRKLVQPELSLEGVKVLRNDLSDSDLEVVARNAAAESASRLKRAGGAGARSPVEAVGARQR